MGEDWYRMQGMDVVETRRGGKVTYHGPGQLVGYPIVRINDVVEYVQSLEGALVSALGERGITAGAAPRKGATSRACGSRIERSPRSACTSHAA